MAGIRQIFELHDEYNLEISLCTSDLIISIFKTYFCPINIALEIENLKNSVVSQEWLWILRKKFWKQHYNNYVPAYI